VSGSDGIASRCLPSSRPIPIDADEFAASERKDMLRLKLGCAALVLGAALALTGGAAQAQVQCEPPGGFAAWIDSFKRYAVAQGVSPRTASAALDGLTLNRQVISLDRDQRAFRLSFEEWIAQRVAPRVNRGAQMLRRHGDLLARIERQYGVPGPVIVAIWGLESDFGANTGNMSIIRSLATLAHDCRRTEMFQAELIAALKIIDRGDLRPSEMRGAWAGEIGQTQFLATNYERFAVDFDGNGRRDLIGSTADVLASTANYLRAHGWRAGEPWDEGTHNFQVLREWNSAPIYQRAIALFANRLADRPAQGAASGSGLSAAQARELQRLLTQRGHDIGPVDGIIGPRTRAAAAAERRRLGLPDGAISEEFLARLRQ
jgi:lytic murein transglycosylase